MPEENSQVERMPSLGGSHLRMPDGALKRVAGTDLHESELEAAKPLLAAHAETQAAAAKAEAEAKKAAKRKSAESPTDAARPVETSAAPNPADSSAVPTEDGQAGVRRGTSR